MNSQPTDQHAPRRSAGRGVLLVLAAAALVCFASLAWLASSESGFRSVCRIAERLSGGRLQLTQPRGTLLGPWRLQSLRWRDAANDLRLEQPGVDWQPAALLKGQLKIGSLSATSLRIASPPTSTPPQLPSSLKLPFAPEIGRLTLGKLFIADYGLPDAPGLLVAQDIGASLAMAQGRYVLSALRASLAQTLLEGSAQLQADAPFGLQAGVRASGKADGHAFMLDLSAEGPLQRFDVAGDASGDKVTGTLRARITPFSTQPFAQALLDVKGINPADWLDGAPQGDLAMQATLLPAAGPGSPVAGEFTVRNSRPGRIDQQLLPLSGLRGHLRWQAGELRLDDVVADLQGGGKLRGTGVYLRQQLALDLQGEAINAAALHGQLKPTRLSGPVKAGLSLLRQSIDTRLTDPRFTVAARLSLRQRDLTIESLHLDSGAASLIARGRLLLNDRTAFDLEGRLKNFDPARFVTSPAARLNAEFQASGALRPQPALALRFNLADSEFNRQRIAGAGSLQLENQRLHHVDLQLNAGSNTLRALGARGATGDKLRLNIDAPRLEPFGIDGDLNAQLELGGSLASPSFEGRAQSDKFGIPDVLQLSGLRFEGRLGLSAGSPLAASLEVARLGLPGQPGLASAVRIDIAGSRAQHRLTGRARIQEKFALDLAAEGSLIESGTAGQGWAGRILDGGVTGKAPLVRLAAPATLTLGTGRMSLGRADLNGPGWSARVESLERDQGRWRSRGTLSQFPLRLVAMPESTLAINGEWDLAIADQLQGEIRLSRAGGDVIFGDTTRLSLGLQEASLRLTAIDQRLRAEWALRGSRLGESSGKLDAASSAPAQLDRLGAWQGELTLNTPDVAWAAALLGEGYKLGGQVDASQSVSGTPAQPALRGKMRGARLTVQLPDQDLQLVQGTLLAELEGETLYLRQLGFDSLLRPPPRALQLQSNADLARITRQPGRLEASGEMQPLKESGHLDFRLDRLGVVQRPDQWIALSGEGQVRLNSGVLGVTGKTRVDAGWWQLARAGAPTLSDDVIIRRAGTSVIPARPAALKRNLDIDADLGGNFHFRGAGVESRLAGSVRIRAENNQSPRATGSIQTVDGQYDAYGQKLAIDRGIINFQGLIDNPGLNIRALRKNLEVEAGVEVGGTVQRPLVRLISEPNVPDAEKLSWLVQGRGLAGSAGADGALLLSAARTILGGGDSGGGVIRQLQNAFGIDVFGISSGSLDGSAVNQPTSRVASARGFDGGGQTASGQIISVGKRLSSNALISYEQSMGSTESIVKLTVDLTQRLSLIGRTGTTNAIDLFYSFSFGK